MSELTYDEKLNFTDEHIKLPGSSIEGDDLLTLVSLTCYLTKALQDKAIKEAKEKGEIAKTIRPFQIINKACGINPNMMLTERDLNEKVSLICEIFMTDRAKFSTCGHTSSKGMLDNIKQIINDWLPF